MFRILASNPDIESLRKDARQWLKALRANDAQAWARLRAALPQRISATPTLREVQLALARERGHPGWAELKTAVSQGQAARRSREELADEMLRQMIWHGDPAVGARLLRKHPQLATHSFLTAVATGDLPAVQHGLTADPAAAVRPGGPLGWEPLLYLASSRLPGHEGHAVAIAQALLDHGANVNARWVDDWQNPFTALTCVIAQGEGVKPPHPRADELVALLLARGADPRDTQALYNTSIVEDDTHWLEVLWDASVARGVTDRWSAVPPPPSPGKPALNQLDYLLGNAVTYGHLRRAVWLLEHGADADALHVYTGRRLPELAQLHGATQMLALLRQHGAQDVPLGAEAAFQLACREGNFERARSIARASPQIIGHAAPLALAAALDLTDLIDLLLELGTPIDIMDEEGVRALQRAVLHDARAAVRHLLDRGAQVDTPTKHYGGAMGTAAHFGRHDCAMLLAPHSRDVHNMVRLGLGERLSELFAAEPALVHLPHFRLGSTPLFWLPEEEGAALEMARLLLAHGADAAARDREGATAAQLARRRGLDTLAGLLGG